MTNTMKNIFEGIEYDPMADPEDFSPVDAVICEMAGKPDGSVRLLKAMEQTEDPFLLNRLSQLCVQSFPILDDAKDAGYEIPDRTMAWLRYAAELTGEDLEEGSDA